MRRNEAKSAYEKVASSPLLCSKKRKSRKPPSSDRTNREAPSVLGEYGGIEGAAVVVVDKVRRGASQLLPRARHL